MAVDLEVATASEVVAALADGSLGSRELLDAQLDRIERLDPALNAVVALDAERARQRARAADEGSARGERWGALHGLPMTIKDSFETEGIVTTAGAPGLAGHVPARDADAVARLKAAGAIVVGKTNLPIYAGDWQSYNDLHGLTRNPWDLGRTVGGSSGGSAAAVAAGLSLLELGSDIGGSIRVPSHYCGVFGHKPTWSAVPHRGHIPGAPGSLAQPDLGVMGPIGRSTDDLELALGVLVGDDPGGVPGGRLPGPPPDLRSLRGRRIGLWLEDDAVATGSDVLGVLRGLADALSDAGAILDERARPSTPLTEAVRVYERLLFSVIGAGYPPEVVASMREVASSAHPDDDAPAVRTARAVTTSHADWLRDDERRTAIAAEWAQLFTTVDVVLAPISSVVAFPHDIDRPFGQRVLEVDGGTVPYVSHLVWASLATLPLLPATAVPVGLSPAGLPVGAQIIGPRWGDRTTLAYSRLVEELVGGFTAPPAR